MTVAATSTPWLVRFKPNAQARLRLFCFPYAGGGARAFRHWPGALPSSVEVCALQLPGRESRIREPALVRISDIVEAAAEALLPHLDQTFAFFGHSMGAFIGFDLARLLRARHRIEPALLCASGCRAPQLRRKRPTTYDRPKPEFLAELRRLNGTPREVLEDPELMDVMLPILRADFEASETYAYADGAPLGCPVAAFGGLDDPEAGRQDIRGWCEQTSDAFSMKMFPGDHFFLHSAQSLLLDTLSRQLRQIAPGPG